MDFQSFCITFPASACLIWSMLPLLYPFMHLSVTVNMFAQVFAFTLLGQAVQGAAFAEYASVPEAMLGRVPSALSMEAACTVGLSSLTAAMGIYKCLQLPMKAATPDIVPVLVYGASSSTGAFVVSLLRSSGYRVVAVASEKHHKWLKDTVGASQVVDYTDKAWMQKVAADSANAGMKYAIDCIAQVDTGDNLSFIIIIFFIWWSEHGAEYLLYVWQCSAVCFGVAIINAWCVSSRYSDVRCR